MRRWLSFVTLGVAGLGFVACGNTDTELAQAFDPLNGTDCSPQGSE